MPALSEIKNSVLDASPFSERRVWEDLGAEWQPLGGSFSGKGFSVEWHDFQAREEFDWSASLHPESIEVCLNLEGTGTIQHGKHVVAVREETAVFYLPKHNELTATRAAGQRHQFITLEIAPEFLRSELVQSSSELKTLLRPVMNESPPRDRVSEIIPLTATLLNLVNSLRKPPVVRQAHEVWYRGKALEMMAELFFEPTAGDLFVTRQQRIARDRVRQVVDLLKSELAEPPSLEQIGRKIGCSPFYLSRTFSKEMNMTIPQYLRKLRIDRAAELLRQGRHNVTEVALEVGYNSLSHFSQAFCQQMGCCPAMYPGKPKSR